MTTLRVERVFDLPLAEVSGLGQRPGRASTSQELLAVGDEEFTVVVAALEEGPALGPPERRVVAAADDHPLEDRSQWEAADGDRSGRVFVLQEDPSRMFILSPGFDEVLHVVDLPLQEAAPHREDWSREPNLEGEGLVLLRNGHVLVVKEKAPVALIEFGPAGESSEGVEPWLLFTTEGEFPFPEGRRSRFDRLASWEVDAGDEGLGDVSDVAVGPDGRLYILSDESRCIARVEARVDPATADLRVTKTWRLTEDIRQPEGLVLTPDMVPLVAVDRQDPKEDGSHAGGNLFVLAPLQG